MCDPFTAGAAALIAGGTMSQANTQANYVSAANQANSDAYAISRAARQQEEARQRAYESRSTESFDKTLAASTAEADADARAKSEASLMEQFDAQPVTRDATTRLPGQEGANVEVSQLIAQKVNEASAEARKRVQNLAKANAFGLAAQGRGDVRQGVADELATIGGLRRGSLGVSQMEQDVRPAEVTPGDDTLGQIMSGAGQLMLLGGPNMFSGMGAKFGLGATASAPAASVRPVANPFY